MKGLAFVLNLPYTAIGIAAATISFPKKIIFLKEHLAFIADVRSLWWSVGWMKGARAATIGHVVLLGPWTEQGDQTHELVHVRQYQENPLIFPFLYYVELMKKGYRSNKYEEAAYQEAGNRYENQKLAAKSQKL